MALTQIAQGAELCLTLSTWRSARPRQARNRPPDVSAGGTTNAPPVRCRGTGRTARTAGRVACRACCGRHCSPRRPGRRCNSSGPGSPTIRGGFMPVPIRAADLEERRDIPPVVLHRRRPAFHGAGLQLADLTLYHPRSTIASHCVRVLRLNRPGSGRGGSSRLRPRTPGRPRPEPGCAARRAAPLGSTDPTAHPPPRPSGRRPPSAHVWATVTWVPLDQACALGVNH